jgi:hypothetical protein
MTGRSLAVQGGLAVLGLVTVYATWQREPEHAPGAVTVIDASKSDVTLIHYEDDAAAVDLKRGKTGDEDGVWLPWSKPDEKRPRPKAPAKPGCHPDAAPARSARRDNAKKRRAVRAPTLRAFGAGSEQARAGPHSPTQARRDGEGLCAVRDRAADRRARAGVPARHPRRTRH